MLIPQHIESLFYKVLEQPSDIRAPFLDQACGNDIGLRQEITRLLQDAEDSSGFFENFAIRINRLYTSEDNIEPQEEKRIGEWRLLSVLGQGGMGKVYLAERTDHHYTQRVALKILPAGRDDSVARCRFSAERKILAQLSHKDIARFIDGGMTEDGTQYFAMEYIDGMNIKDHCRKHTPTIRAILDMFLNICEAVQYAHDHLIIHRDLKPGNVMVDNAGKIKLLDFGIAKILEADRPNLELTQVVPCPMSLGYSSPEMLGGETVTITTDVYSLGILLYELLTGHRPYSDSDEPARGLHLLQFNREAKPASAMADSKKTNNALQGDLDTILAKAIRVKPEERYASVREMSEDIKRYIAGFPVKAKSHTTLHHINKFIARHRVSSAAVGIASLALFFSVFFSAYHMLEAQSQRDLAQYQQKRMQITHDFLNLLIEEIGPHGKAMTLEELLDRGVSMLHQKFETRPHLAGQILFELSRSYNLLGNKKKNKALLEKAELAARQAADPELLSTILCARADELFLTDSKSGTRIYQEALQAKRGLSHYSIDNQVHCAMAKARSLEQSHKLEEALALTETTLAKLKRVSESVSNLHFVLINRRTLLLYSLGRRGEVLQSNNEAISLMEENGRELTIGYMVEKQNRAILLNMMGEVREYADLCRQVLDSFVSHDGQSQRPDKFIMRYADALIRLGKYDEALTLYQENIKNARDQGHKLYAAHHQLGMGRVFVQRGEMSKAEAHFVLAERQYVKSPALSQRKLSWITLERANILRIQGKSESAIRIIEDLLQILGYPQRRDGFQLSQTLRSAAHTALELSNETHAKRYIEDFLMTARQLARADNTSADVGNGLLLRAQWSLKYDNPDSAREDLTKAISILTTSAGGEHPDTLSAVQLLLEIKAAS